MAENEQFFPISNYPTKRKSEFNSSYIRVLDGKGDDKGKDELNKGTQIEILWKDGKKTLHEVIIKTESSSTYCRDAERTYEDHRCYPYIDMVHRGMILREVPLFSIEDIKVRITHQANYNYEDEWRKANTHISKADDIAKGEKIVEVEVDWNRGLRSFKVPDESKPIVCCPNCTKELRRKDFLGKELYTTPQWYTNIDGYKLCPFCQKAKGTYCYYIIPEKPKPKAVICMGCVAAKQDSNVICKKHHQN